MKILKYHNPDTGDKSHLFLYVVHDWIAHILHETPLLDRYDFTVRDVIKEYTQDTTSITREWMSKIMGREKTLPTLLYRQYLFNDMLLQEIYPDITYKPLYVLMGSMLYKDVEFTPSGESPIWKQLEDDSPLINRLRIYRPRIQRMVSIIMERRDDTPMNLTRNHGILSSHTVLYILYLVQVIMIYENTIKPDVNKQIIIQSLKYTLDQLKGVFFHVKDQWIAPHV